MLEGRLAFRWMRQNWFDFLLVCMLRNFFFFLNFSITIELIKNRNGSKRFHRSLYVQIPMSSCFKSASKCQTDCMKESPYLSTQDSPKEKQMINYPKNALDCF